MIGISACLLGENCKYSGGNNKNEKIIEYLKNKKYYAFCPEVKGGLPCPRPPAEIRGNQIVDKEGNDVTAAFHKGAEIVLNELLERNITECILKANSPSCGCGEIYDGSFSGKLISGNGCTADLLLKHNFTIRTEKNFK